MQKSTEVMLNARPLSLAKRRPRFSAAELKAAPTLRGFHAPQRPHYRGPDWGPLLDKDDES